MSSSGRETFVDLLAQTNCCQKIASIVSLTLTPDKRIYLRVKNKLHAAWLIPGSAKCAPDLLGRVLCGARR